MPTMREDHNRQIENAKIRQLEVQSTNNLKLLINSRRLSVEQLCGSKVKNVNLEYSQLIITTEQGNFFACEFENMWGEQSLQECGITIDEAKIHGIVSPDECKEYEEAKKTVGNLNFELTHKRELEILIDRVGKEVAQEVLNRCKQ